MDEEQIHREENPGKKSSERWEKREEKGEIKSTSVCGKIIRIFNPEKWSLKLT